MHFVFFWDFEQAELFVRDTEERRRRNVRNTDDDMKRNELREGEEEED